MKKVLLFAVIAMFLMVPMSFAKTAISDSDLDGVTAQEGVVIVLDNVNVSNVSLAVQSWGDADGFTDSLGNAYTHAGWVGATITMSGQVVSLNGVMTIDVGTDATNTLGYHGGVYIGLPTVTIGGTDGLDITQEVKVGFAKELNQVGTFQTMGTAFMGGLKAQVTGNLMITTSK